MTVQKHDETVTEWLQRGNVTIQFGGRSSDKNGSRGLVELHRIEFERIHFWGLPELRPNSFELAGDKHIEFPAQGIGQEIACPHCGTAITLRKPGDSPKEEKL